MFVVLATKLRKNKLLNNLRLFYTSFVYKYTDQFKMSVSQHHPTDTDILNWLMY